MLESKMGITFLTSKFNLFFKRNVATQGLIKRAIGVGFKQSYRLPGFQEHSIKRYLNLCSSSRYLFNRFNRVNTIPRGGGGGGVRFFHVKGNGSVPSEEKGDFSSPMLKFLISNIITFYIVRMSVERVPYSNNIHLVFASDMLERRFGTDGWKKMKEECKKCSSIVEQDNPEVIRVQKILNVLLGAMHVGLGLEHGYTINETDFAGSSSSKANKLEGVVKKIENRRGSRFDAKYGIKHLEGLDWEVMLLNDDIDNAFHVPNGKIAVYAGAVNGHSDSRIAATIAHEIGHGIARHQGESIFRAYWYYRVLRFVGVPDFVQARIELFLSRRNELEADYIGLILMASAGYDPRAAPDAYCNDGHRGTSESTHPSARKRAKMLEKNMAKAVAIYEQVQAGQEVKSFI